MHPNNAHAGNAFVAQSIAFINVQDNVQGVKALLTAGFTPVLHGDAVLDDRLGCTILSGDTVVARLAEALRPECVVFLTNVDGIYDRPPEQEGASRIAEISVQPGTFQLSRSFLVAFWVPVFV